MGHGPVGPPGAGEGRPGVTGGWGTALQPPAAEDGATGGASACWPAGLLACWPRLRAVLCCSPAWLQPGMAEERGHGGSRWSIRVPCNLGAPGECCCVCDSRQACDDTVTVSISITEASACQGSITDKCSLAVVRIWLDGRAWVVPLAIVIARQTGSSVHSETRRARCSSLGRSMFKKRDQSWSTRRSIW
jgi:hypothetical protein